MKKFPIYKYNHIFNKFSGKIEKEITLKNLELTIDYPCRLDAMAINPAAVCYNDDMMFTPGEVVISTKKYIRVNIRKIEGKNILKVSDNTKRKVLVKHTYVLMKDVIKFTDSFEIDVIDDEIPKHCGFGSSSSTIAAVAVALNEMYGNPISSEDLIKYLAANHGEEINDLDEENLKMVQCIGGGATNGLTKEGVLIIAGHATSIAKMYYEADILIGIPNDFQIKNADYLMQEEEKNLWKFKKTGEEYAEKIAYNLLHKAIPDMVNGSIKELAKVVFEYRFNMGSNENCSFVYDNLMKISDSIRKLYENNECEFLALSSVGPAFFILVNDKLKKEKCKKYMENLNLKVIESSICNEKYKIINCKTNNCFWEKENVGELFRKKLPSEYITNQIDLLNIDNKKCIDIGCGGGRYSKYLKSKNANVLAIDKHPAMFDHTSNINFIKCSMNNIPVIDNTYYLALSIGVIHNSVTINEYVDSLKEIYRILEKKGYALLSTFTDDVISSDLKKTGKNTYAIKNRPPMVLLSKEQILNYINQIGFKLIKEVDEHITNVGSGERNVYTILIQK